MIRHQNSFYFVSILLAVEVLPFPQLQDSALSVTPDPPLISSGESSDFTNWDQGRLIASGVPQGQKLWLGDSNLFSHQGGSVTNIPPDTSKDSALQFDGNDGVTNVVPPNFPNLLRTFFPNGIPQFDPDGVNRWFTRPQQPGCDDGKFAFCCQLGPPRFRQNNDKPIATEAQKQEIERRLRKCRIWSADDPACFFPENEACCDCKSEVQIAFECYNPNWRNNLNLQGTPQRPPVLLPKSSTPDPDPDPSEPSPEHLGEEKLKREWTGQLFEQEEIDTTDSMDGKPGRMDRLYAEKSQSYRHPGGRERFESTCSDEYLESKGVRILRYRPPSVYTPEDPFVSKPKGPDRRMGVNKPKRSPIPAKRPRPQPP